jgi:predicted Fe-Mo cluster-binding NifX family protein
MSYKIAIASSDEINIDESFGAAERFIIYEVDKDHYEKVEERKIEGFKKKCNSNGCGTQSGCGGNSQHSEKVQLIEDCRCIVCKKIGFPVQKQLERKAISAFDVSCTIEEALQKISLYFKRVDGHQTLRGFGK